MNFLTDKLPKKIRFIKKPAFSEKKNVETQDLASLHFKLEPPKTRRAKILHIFGNILIVLLILIIFIIILGSLSFLRYRQTCSFQNLVNDGRLVTQDLELCPDPLQEGGILKIISNLFNFNFYSKLQVNSTYTANDFTITKTCTEEIDPICWIKQAQGELKQTDGYTNVLLVGSDSRSTNNTLGNTDSIMLLSFQHSSGQVLLISFPRDLIVKFKDTRNSNETLRINSIYAIYEVYGKGKGVENLNLAISQIIGKPIHYYAYFNFVTFEKAIDRLGGIDINLPKKFQDVYPSVEVPKGVKCNKSILAKYCLFTFPAGLNHFSSFEALVYSRARQLSTDYERAGRQQEVVKATINTALKNNLPLNEKFSLYLDMYNTLSANVKTNITTSDITGLFKLYDKLSDNVGRIVLEPSLGKFRIVKDVGVTQYGWSIMFYDYTYKSFQKLIADTWKFLPYNNEKPKVLVLNTSGKEISSDSEVGKLLNSGNPYWELKKVNDTSVKYSAVRIYDMSRLKPGSLNDVVANLPSALLYNAEIENIKQSDFKEDILIVVGE